jgi:mRNA interferase MazF
MKRGALVLVRTKGDFTGKPRPGVIVQSDLFNPTHRSVTTCPITSQLVDAPLFRVSLIPTTTNGLKKPSQVMVDKVFSVRRENISKEIGVLDRETMAQIDQALRTWLQLQ